MISNHLNMIESDDEFMSRKNTVDESVLYAECNLKPECFYTKSWLQSQGWSSKLISAVARTFGGYEGRQSSFRSGWHSLRGAYFVHAFMHIPEVRAAVIAGERALLARQRFNGDQHKRFSALARELAPAALSALNTYAQSVRVRAS